MDPSYFLYNSQKIPQYDGLNRSLTDSDDSTVTDGNLTTHSPNVLTKTSDTLEESWFSQEELSILQEETRTHFIPVHVSVRNENDFLNQNPRNKSNNITIRRDNKLIEALSLPIFSVYNMRSIWSKLSSLGEDMVERDCDFSILSEVWEKKENIKHQARIEELLEMKDTKYFSTARPGTKRGGGAAITARGNRFHITKLNIDIPKPLEVVWCLFRPKIIHGGVSKLIACSFYSPPNSRKKAKLIDHMAVTIHRLKVSHPKASFIIAGDKNDLNEKDILGICPSFRQIVLKPTRKNKTLTIVITDLHRFFHEPFIIPPVPVDDGATGVPSDHQGVLVLPLGTATPKAKTKKPITIRPIMQSALENFGQTIVKEEWSFLESSLSSSTQVERFQDFCSNLVEN